MNNTEEIVNGLIKYADREVIPQLNTQAKWIVGTLAAVAVKNAKPIIDNLQRNEMLKMMHVVDQNGMFDVDAVADGLKESAEKYGKLQFNIPAVGVLSFDHNDVDVIRKYIKGEM